MAPSKRLSHRSARRPMSRPEMQSVTEGPRTSSRVGFHPFLTRAAHLGGKRLLGYSVLVLLCLLLAWQIVSSVMPPETAAGESLHRVDWDRTSPPAVIGLAENHIVAASEAEEDVDWTAIERAASRAVRINPLQARAIVLLALAAEARGEDDQALRLMRHASQLTLREPRAHLWLFDHLVRHGDFAGALWHADTVLRSQPRRNSLLLAPLMAMAADSDGATFVAALLDRNPPWRSWFLRAFSGGAEDPLAPTALYIALQAGSHPPSQAELRPHLDRLIESGRFEQAFLLWRRFLEPHQQEDFRYLFNGDFRFEISNLPFDWIVHPVKGAMIEVGQAPGGNGRALLLQFARARVATLYASKLLVLPPGTYALSGNAEARHFGNQRGLWWRLVCAEGDKEILLSTERLTGTVARHSFSESFVVPASGCRAQWLTLELAARAVREQEVEGGSLFYDSLEVRRVEESRQAIAR